MTVRARRASLRLEMNSVVRYEHLPRLPQAGVASALVLRFARGPTVWAQSTAVEPPILMDDHRLEVDPRHAIRAACAKETGTRDARRPAKQSR